MKKLLFILFLFFGFSSYANASLLQVTNVSSRLGNCTISVGDIGTKAYFSGLVSSPSSCYYSTPAYKNCWITSSNKAYCNQGFGDGKQIVWFTTATGCPVGKVPNEETGACEEPQEDFCSSSEWLELSATEGNACAAQYPDHLTDFSASCTS
ncbi:hypothetical protein AB4189_24335, partial [Vibrio sp. 10N.286.49.E1]|uniref:hypothetical protein n=1 Tax=Vibrio sp. 10N.286.49.E1 TaxID=3229702 RepID=UPI00354CED41